MALPRNYRQGTEERNCGNCRYLHPQTVFCDRWNEHVDRGFLCDAWEAKDLKVVTVTVKRKGTE